MKMFYKSRYSLVLILVLSLVMQIAAPVVGNFAYAEETEEAFKVDTIMNEDGTANVNWEYEYVYDVGINNPEIDLGLELIEEQSGDLESDKGIIGKYEISLDGKMSVKIVDEAEIQELLKIPEKTEDEDPIEPESIETLTPIEEESDKKDDEIGPIETEVEKDEIEDVDDAQKSNDDNEIPSRDDDLLDTEPESNKGNEDTDSARKIDGFLGLFSRNEVYAEGDKDETIESYTFTGNFDVEGVIEEEDEIMPIMNLLGDGEGEDPVTFTDVKLKFKNNEGVEIKVPPYPLDSKVEMKFEFKIADILSRDDKDDPGIVDTNK